MRIANGNSNILIGCSGFAKSQKDYYQNFQLVEIQQTFYKPPLLKTAIRWREQAPESFIFTLKAWQLITHEPYQPTYRRLNKEIPRSNWGLFGSFRPTAEVMHAWEKTQEIAKALRATVILFQCPAQFTPTQEHIDHFKRFFDAADPGPFRYAWEPRGEWPGKLIRELCDQYNLIHAVDPFLRDPETDEMRYFRLHGGSDYQHQFSNAELMHLYEIWDNFPGYCLFNNVSMWEDALRFRKLYE